MFHSMNTILKNISDRLHTIYLVWLREFKLVFSDTGVLIFFFVLPTLYPLVYTFIYNPEVVRDIPVAVVDNSRSARSREFTRMADATEAIKIIGYASSLDEARHWQNDKACYGILVIPDDYDRKIGRGEQATIIFYYEMSLLIRYRTLLSALTDLSLATGTMIQQEQNGFTISSPVNSSSVTLGDTSEGFASFVIPGILVLIIQQSLILGIAMLGGGSNERRRLNLGIDPLAINASPAYSILGKSLCYFVIYIPLVTYMLLFIPMFFNLPRIGSYLEILLFIVPMIFSSIFMGLTIQRFVSEREASMLIIVVTSVIFLFLSGLTWPRFAMSPMGQVIGGLIPATWGIEGFIRLNSNGASLSQNATPYMMLWALTALYFTLAVFTHSKKTIPKI